MKDVLKAISVKCFHGVLHEPVPPQCYLPLLLSVSTNLLYIIAI